MWLLITDADPSVFPVDGSVIAYAALDIHTSLAKNRLRR